MMLIESPSMHSWDACGEPVWTEQCLPDDVQIPEQIEDQDSEEELSDYEEDEEEYNDDDDNEKKRSFLYCLMDDFFLLKYVHKQTFLNLSLIHI